MNRITPEDWDEIWDFATTGPERNNHVVLGAHGTSNGEGSELDAVAIVRDTYGLFWVMEASTDMTGWTCINNSVDWYGPFKTMTVALNHTTTANRVKLGYEEGLLGNYDKWFRS